MAVYDNINRRGYGTTQAWPEYNENYNENFGKGLAGSVGYFDPRNRMLPSNLSQDLGASTYQAPPVYPGSAYSPHRGFEEMEFDETVQAPEKTGIDTLKETIKGWTTPTLDFLKKIGGRMTPEKRAEVEAIRGSADQYGWGNLPGTGLQGNIWKGGSGGDKVYVRAPDGTMILRDKNLQSAFGSKTIGDMVTKKENWMQGQFDKYGDEWTDDEHKGLSTKLYNYAKNKGLIDQWRGTTPVDTTAGGATTIGAITGGDTTGGGSTYTGPPTTSFNVAQFAKAGRRQDKPGGFTDPGKESYGPHKAEGGRIGYNRGRVVNPGGYAGEGGGGILETIKNFPKNLKSGFEQIFSGETAAYLGDNQEKINEFLAEDMWGVEGDMNQETIEMIIDMNKKGMGIDEIVSLTGSDNKTVNDIISILNRKAEGGRIGYQDGELVEDEYMAEATPGGMMEENIEEVQGEPSREQLEAIALEIFRLPLEELNEEQLNVVYQAAMEQEPAEEEIQFAAQEGPGEGIASLV